LWARNRFHGSAAKSGLAWDTDLVFRRFVSAFCRRRSVDRRLARCFAAQPRGFSGGKTVRLTRPTGRAASILNGRHGQRAVKSPSRARASCGGAAPLLLAGVSTRMANATELAMSTLFSRRCPPGGLFSASKAWAIRYPTPNSSRYVSSPPYDHLADRWHLLSDESAKVRPFMESTLIFCIIDFCQSSFPPYGTISP